MKSNYFITVILIFVFTAVGFFTGMKYQQSRQSIQPDFQAMKKMDQNSSERQGFLGENQPGGQQGSQAGGMVRGEIISKDDSSITVKLTDDSSKIVLITDETKINQAVEASLDDLNEGDQVMVMGEKNSDESISALQIQLNFGLMGRE